MNRVRACSKTVLQTRVKPTTLALPVAFVGVMVAGGITAAVLHPFESLSGLLVSTAIFGAVSVLTSAAVMRFVFQPAQQRLIAQEQRLRSMAIALPDRVVMLDAEGRYHAVLKSEYNTAPSNQYGGVVGDSLHDVFPLEFADFCLQKTREIIASNHGQIFDYDLHYGDEHFRIEGHVVPTIDPMTGRPCVIWVSRDITERTKIQNQLMQSEKLLRSIFHALPDRTLIFDAEGNYLEILQPASHLFSNTPGGNHGVQSGDSLYKHFTTDFADFCIQKIRQTVETNEMQVFEYVSPLHFPPRHFEARTIPFADPVSGTARVLWVTRDMTLHHQAEKQRLELALQQEKLDFFEQFVNNITHDLKTPLTVIETGLYFVQRAEDAIHRQVRIDNIRQQVIILNQMIDDLLTIGMLDGAPRLDAESLDIVDLLREALRQLQPRLEKKNHLLSTLYTGTPVILSGSRKELNRALMNLIDNAIKYTPDNGRIGVELSVGDNEAVIEVQDSGIGIKADDIPHIFERFYRSESGRHTASGTGLGLSIVRRIVELHGGRIDVESQPGQGSTFYVHLPVHSSPANASTA